MTKLIEALRVAHRQRVQQDRIQHSEDDDVGPNAQHQSEYGYGRERGRLAKHAQRITNIQQQVLQERVELACAENRCRAVMPGPRLLLPGNAP